MSEFRDHLMGTAGNVLVALDRKAYSLEQMAKFVKVRVTLATEYAKNLEKLASRSSSGIYFEESGLSRAWTELLKAEVANSQRQLAFAEEIQRTVLEQIVNIKEAIETMRKNVGDDYKKSTQKYQDALFDLNHARELYLRASRDLEVAQYLQKEEASQGGAQGAAKKEKKVAKLTAEVKENKEAYEKKIAEMKVAQDVYYHDKLPIMLDSLEVVFRQRIQSITSALTSYCDSMLKTYTDMQPRQEAVATCLSEVSPDHEIEDFISKTETFFIFPADPVFEQFVRTPEGQIPPGVQAQKQAFPSFLHFRRQDKSSESAGDLALVSLKKPETDLFKLSLDQMMQLQKDQFPELKVPYILVFLADCTIKRDGPTCPGIFRLSGSLPRQEPVKQRLNRGEYVIPGDVLDSSSIFKLVLRSLPEPLVPAELYEEAINEPLTVHEVFKKIPTTSRNVAGFVVRFIRDYFINPESIELTQMSAENLATVFCPCFLRNPSTDFAEVMQKLELEKAWMLKCFSTLDVSEYPSLSECIAKSKSVEIPDSPKEPPAHHKLFRRHSSKSLRSSQNCESPGETKFSSHAPVPALPTVPAPEIPSDFSGDDKPPEKKVDKAPSEGSLLSHSSGSGEASSEPESSRPTAKEESPASKEKGGDGDGTDFADELGSGDVPGTPSSSIPVAISGKSADAQSQEMPAAGSFPRPLPKHGLPPHPKKPLPVPAPLPYQKDGKAPGTPGGSHKK